VFAFHVSKPPNNKVMRKKIVKGTEKQISINFSNIHVKCESEGYTNNTNNNNNNNNKILSAELQKMAIVERKTHS